MKSALIAVLFAGGLAGSAGADEHISADERAIRSLEEKEATAVLKQDVATLEQLMSERYIVNNPQNGVTPDREGVLDRVRRGLIRYSSFERHIDAIRIDGDIAIVMGSEKVMPIGDAPRAGHSVLRRYTNIWKRTGSTWRAIARHANVVPAE